MEISDKTILITGASDGIGREIALRLAREGAKLILLGRDTSRLSQVEAEVKKAGSPETFTYSFDLSDRNSMTDHLEKIRQTHTDLSALINNAGIWQKVGDLDLLNHDEIEQIVNTNITSLIKVTNTLLPVLRKQNEAIILNISSRSGVVPMPGQSVYVATKFGIRGFTQSLREDLKETNIHVAGLYQGGTKTKMFEKAGERWDDAKYDKFIPAPELAEIVHFMLTRPAKVWLPEVRVENH